MSRLLPALPATSLFAPALPTPDVTAPDATTADQALSLKPRR